jgi:hypothetical protein
LRLIIKIVSDIGIKEIADIAKNGLAEKYSEDDILGIVKQKSKRAEVSLLHKPLQDVFIERIRSWRKK